MKTKEKRVIAISDDGMEFDGLIIGTRNGYIQVRDQDDNVFELEASQIEPAREQQMNTETVINPHTKRPCKHLNTRAYPENPNRVRCLGCGLKFNLNKTQPTRDQLGLGGDLLTPDEIFDEAERIRRIEAAAPELLRACKDCLPYLEFCEATPSADPDYAGGLVCQLRIAIAKAEGMAQ